MHFLIFKLTFLVYAVSIIIEPPANTGKIDKNSKANVVRESNNSEYSSSNCKIYNLKFKLDKMFEKSSSKLKNEVQKRTFNQNISTIEEYLEDVQICRNSIALNTKKWRMCNIYNAINYHDFSYNVSISTFRYIGQTPLKNYIIYKRKIDNIWHTLIVHATAKVSYDFNWKGKVIIMEYTTIRSNVFIDFNTIIGKNNYIDKNVTIGPRCSLLSNIDISSFTVINSDNIFLGDNRIGNKLSCKWDARKEPCFWDRVAFMHEIFLERHLIRCN